MGIGNIKKAAIASGLNIKGVINSPTFNIVKCYFDSSIPLYHIDAYRLEDLHQDLGLEEYIDKVKSFEQLNELKEEMIDKTGKLPESIDLLFEKKIIDLYISSGVIDSYDEVDKTVVVKLSKDFMNYKNGPILTDCGGFQVFSLAKNKKKDIVEEGVHFKSHIDGKIFKFTPESNMEVQNKLGADIIMQLDICSPYGATRKDVIAADARTVEWLKRCYAAHNNPKQSLFPIVQGNFYKDLRLKSLENALPYAKHGIAVGGLAIGEPFTVLKEQLENLAPHLPQELPHYLMGAGTPDYILEGIENGIDMFDCVYQTRMARHGIAITDDGNINLRNQKYQTDFTPILN